MAAATPRTLVLLLALWLLASPGSAIRLPGFQRDCSNKAHKARAGSVVLGDSGFAFSAAAEGGVAWGSFLDGAHTRSNFGQLRVATSGAYADADQLFAAGFLEGFLTAERVYDNFVNMRDYFTGAAGMGAEIQTPMKWIEEQHRWVRGQCGSEAVQSGKDARFWQAVCLTLRQFDGLKTGFAARQAELVATAAAVAAAGGDAGAAAAAAAAVGVMSDWDFLFMESSGDLYDIIDWQQPEQRPSWLQGTAQPQIPTVHSRRGGRHWGALAEAARQDPEAAAAKLFSKVALSGKCSALIKLAPDLSDIFMAHATWDTFTAMLRIYKHYHFNLTQLQPAAQRLSFSSYPGELFSDDDFFIMDSGLVMLQTTNKIFNDELFERLEPRTVLSWQRVRAANWLAADGQEWSRHLDTYNSGTYNNQYMVVDLNKFVPGEALRPGLLWVAEQVPGLVAAADMTPMLAFGYWPSFNVPFFPEVYNASGYPDFISKLEEHGQHFGKTTHWLSYQNSPRAKIFRRDQAGVHDLAGMKAIMRGNSWKSDPFSEGHPICAVCGRGDLDPANPVARGCYDAKVTSYRLALQMQSEAVNGPTTSKRAGAAVPPFRWSEPVVANMTHRGQPERFAGFEFERMDPLAEVLGGGASGGCYDTTWRQGVAAGPGGSSGGGGGAEAEAEGALAGGLLAS